MGGVISAVGTVVVLIIGTRHISPWGLLALIPCFRRRVARNIDRYHKGVPFSTFPTIENGDQDSDPDEEKEKIGCFTLALKKEGAEAQLLYLNRRIALLEIVLSDYYLYTEMFEHAAAESAASRRTWREAFESTDRNSQRQSRITVVDNEEDDEANQTENRRSSVAATSDAGTISL